MQVQAAIDAVYAANGGGKVYTIGNIYLGNGDVTVHENMEISGMNYPMQDIWTLPDLDKAQVSRIIITKTTGVGAIHISGNTCIRNIFFWYPNQVTNSIPTAYPPTILVSGDFTERITIKDCCCGNAYYFIDATASHGSVQCDHVYGSPIYRFAQLALCGGGDLFEFVDLWPLYTITPYGNTLLSWIQENLIAFEVYRSDGIRFRNTNILDARYGMLFHGTAAPEISQCGFDAVLNPIYADTAAYNIHIVGCQLDSYRGWGTPLWPVGTTMVFIVGGYGHTIVGNMFRRCGGNGVTIWGGASDCVISDNILPEFGKSASGLNRGIVFEGSGSVISNNNLDAANAANSQGIYISGSDNTITGNSIKRIANSAFELASGSAHNVVVGNNGKTTSGLLDSSGQTNEIAHNYWT